MSAEQYASEYAQKLISEPIRQRLRILRFQWRCERRRAELRAFQSMPGAVTVSSRLRPAAHSYRGYSGPWIEDTFFRSFAARELGSIAATYLPVFWTDVYLHAQTHLFSPDDLASINDEIDSTLATIARDDRVYFTVLEYDHPIWNWHRFPANVVVFSAGGGGDIPIPLLNGEREFRCPPKDILVSFMGQLDGASDRGGVRRRMYDACRDVAVFGNGASWREVMERSTFTLCPRGLGRASFRMYEALSCGSIPIYIWDDVEWLPYADELDWRDLALVVHVDDVHRIPELIAGQSASEIREKQERIRALYGNYFTMRGTCRQIARRAAGLTPASVRALAEARDTRTAASIA